MKWMMLRGVSVVALSVLALSAMAQEERTVSDNIRDEDALIAVLQGDSSWDEKQAACRSLRRVGTPKSIPALAKLLNDPELSHMARYALEPMPYPEAGQALRDALNSTSGMLRVGVISSLGVRRDADAVPRLTPMLKDGNMDIARTAAAALGRIASERAVAALMDAHATAPPRYRQPVVEALLAAGQMLVQDGRATDAIPVYEALLASSPSETARLGAFRGIVNADPKAAPERILAALTGDDALMRDMAGQLVAETSGAEATKAYAEALPGLAPAVQVVLVRGLGGRGDAAAHDAVVAASTSTDTDVQLAALQALTNLGTGEDVAMLAGLLQSDDEALSGAARDALANIEAESADEAIVAAIAAGDPSTQASLMTLLAGRGSARAVEMASEHVKDEAAEVQVAALEILGRLGSADHAGAVIETLLTTANADVFKAASQALGELSEREADAVMKPLMSAQDDAEGEARVAVLRALGRAATPMALEAVVKATSDEALNDEAVKILSNWPTPDAAPHLLKLAKSEDAGLKDTGLRGYVRLVGVEESVTKKVEMLTAVAKLAETPQEKWVVLSAWGQTPSQKSLDALLPQLKDEEVQNEAAAAVIAVASELGKDSKAKAKAVKALKAVVDTVKDESVKARAADALKGLEQ